MSDRPVLTADQAVLFVVRDASGGIESITVFVPYSETRPKWAKSPEWYASRWESHFGPVDICWSWRSSFLTLGRRESGFHTGVTLPTESFEVLDRVEAIQRANTLMKANRR